MKASAVRRGGVGTQNQTLYTTIASKGGSRGGVSEDMVSISTLANGLGALFKSNICDDWRWAPNVDFPIACVLGYPKSCRILRAADNPMTLTEPLFGE